MSILRVVQKTRKSGRTALNESRFRDVYQVLTDDIDHDRTQILSAVDPDTGLAVPQRGDTHEEANNFYAVEIEAEQDNDAKNANNWFVVVTYSNRLTSQDITRLLEFDPTKWAPKISMSRQYREVPFLLDAMGRKVQNAAGDYFDQPVMVRIGYLTYHYERHFQLIPDFYYTHDQTVNHAAITIYGKTWPGNAALIENLACSEQKYEDGVLFFTVTLDILINDRFATAFLGMTTTTSAPNTFEDLNPQQAVFFTRDQEDGHNILIPNRGFNQSFCDGPTTSTTSTTTSTTENPCKCLGDIRESSEKRRIYLADGKQPTVPQALDRWGRWVCEDDDPSNDLNVRFRRYLTSDFSVLGLPP
jgi:hypothetical protein